MKNFRIMGLITIILVLGLVLIACDSAGSSGPTYEPLIMRGAVGGRTAELEISTTRSVARSTGNPVLTPETGDSYVLRYTDVTPPEVISRGRIEVRSIYITFIPTGSGESFTTSFQGRISNPVNITLGDNTTLTFTPVGYTSQSGSRPGGSSPGPGPSEPDLTVRSITMEDDGNGTATATPSSAAAGTLIDITADPDSDYMFKAWEVISGGAVISSLTTNPATFTMPAAAVTIKAIFELIPADTPYLLLTPSPVTWSSVGLGYSAQTPETVTITNDGTGNASVTAIALTVGASSFTLASAGARTINTSDTSTFTVVPNTGLPVGVHNAVVTVTYEGGDVASATAQVNVSFEVRNVFTVTFNSNGGTAVSPITGIVSGATISAPSAPTRTTPLAGLYTGTLSTLPAPDFVEWRAPGANAEFVFADNPITADITLTAQWESNDRITSVTVNNVAAAVTHVRSDPDEYTLLLDSATSINTAQQNFDTANMKLTIIGIGAERTIQLITNRTLFNLSAAGTSLTLGNNITLQGQSTAGSGALIIVTNGSLTMLSGSKIIGHNGRQTGFHIGGIDLNGSSASFTMEGGEITGIHGGAGAGSTGGVHVRGGATFTMKGGTIRENSAGSNYTSWMNVRLVNGTVNKEGGTIATVTDP
ncbi:MAG: hypothetical protein FWG77_11770, partial [Treponema sp.]|nr:hypothetical protein [Treponema sp.]